MAKDTAGYSAGLVPEKKKRSPKAGKRITITLTDEHYAAIEAAAKADDREPNAYLSRQVRLHIELLTGKPSKQGYVA